MTLEIKTTHTTEAVGNLVEQFKNKTVLGEQVTIFAEQIQDLEEVLFQLRDERTIDTAIGDQLDGIGSIVGEDRQGRDDDDYRLAIRARIQLNLSNGTPEDLIELVRAMVGDKTVEIRESFPAHFDLEVLDDIDVDGFDVAVFVSSGKPAGVRGIFLWHVAGEFHYDSGPGYDVGKFGGAVEL